MRRILNLISITSLLLAALGATSVPFVFADDSCVGTGGDDSLECTSASPDYSSGMVVDGGEGEDTITVTDADVNDVNGGEGDDSITVGSDGEAEDVRGDQAFWGGDDTIVVDDDIDGEVEGDSSVFCYDWENDQAASCNDTIVLNGSAYAVIGDDVYQCNDGDCNDDITINGETEVVVGDYTDSCRGDNACNDTITVNGGTLAVIGDQTGRCGDDSCNDTINVNGDAYVVVGDNIAADYDTFGVAGYGGHGTPAGDDTINVGADGFSYLLVGDNIVAQDTGCHFSGFGGYGTQSGDDNITVDGTVGVDYYGLPVGAVIGDNITFTQDSCYFAPVDGADFGSHSNDGNDNITINGVVNGAVIGDSVNVTSEGCGYCFGGGSSESGNDSIVVNGTVNGVIIGDSVNADIDDFDEFGASGFGGGTSSHGNDNIIVNGTVNGTVIGDSIEADVDYDTDFGFGSSSSGNDNIEINGTVNGDVIGDGIDLNIDVSSFSITRASGNDTITVNGTVDGNIVGDWLDYGLGNPYFNVDSSEGNDEINVDGLVTGDVYADSDFSGCYKFGVSGESSSTPDSYENDQITVTGTVEGDIFADTPCDFLFRADGVQGTIAEAANNDVVTLASGGVQYTTKCGDINVTQVGSNTPTATVGGLIAGGEWGSDFDTLYIGLTSISADDYADLQAQIDAAGSDGSVTVGGHTYNWTEFENVQIMGTTYSEGANQLFDNGVVSTFMGSDGKSIDICYQPEGYGYKVSLVNFDELDKGVRQFTVGSEFVAIVNNDTSTCDTKYTPANANWKVELYQNGVLVDNTFCFIH